MWQDVLWWALYKAEPLLLGSELRKEALAEAMRHIHYEARAWQFFLVPAPLSSTIPSGIYVWPGVEQPSQETSGTLLVSLQP